MDEERPRGTEGASPAELHERLARKEHELDVSLERFRLAQELLLQTRNIDMVGQLAGGLAHGFNNLLTVVIGVLDVLSLELPEDSPQRRDVGLAQDAAVRAAEVARRMLILAQRHPPETRPVDVRDVVQAAFDLLRRSFSQRVAIQLSVADGLPPIRGDSARLETALLDLALNARDAMPDGGELAVEVDRVELEASHVAEHAGASTGDHIRIVVRDTGAGMNAATLERVFEPFFTTKAPGSGAGLGLAMVYATVRAHAGHIAVRSAPGAGTTFTIYLPTSTSAPVPAGASAEAEPRGRPEDFERGAGERLLVVDDDPAVLRTTERSLTVLGYSVETADSGAAALEKVEQAAEPFALVLVDIVMPGMGGLATLRRLRELRPGLPALLMTGYAGRDFVPPVDLGAEIVPKPLDLGRLAARIGAAIHRGT
jgi:signal transduction histidine kinase/CheY-like chemotaxis protein